MAPSLSKIWIWADFKMNQDRIAATFCINRDKPITICGGSCYLAKELNKTVNQEDKQQPSSFKLRLTVDYVLNSESTSFQSNYLLKTLQFGDSENDLTPSYLDDIFHPPQYS